eukprot:3231991-Prymnesium_polylepis.1
MGRACDPWGRARDPWAAQCDPRAYDPSACHPSVRAAPCVTHAARRCPRRPRPFARAPSPVARRSLRRTDRSAGS